MTVQGERNGAGVRQEGGEADGDTDTVGESQGGSGRKLNGSEISVERTGQVVVPAESRADVSAHGFWKLGTTAMFDIRIVKLNAGSYLHMTPEKALAKTDKENKDLYLQACLERRRTLILWCTLHKNIWSRGLIHTEEVSRTLQLQAEAGILRNVRLCEDKDVTSNSEV